MNKKKLEDLVPPVEECRAAYEAGVIGDDTALVWVTGFSNDTPGIEEKCIMLRVKSQNLCQDIAAVTAIIPAPTLAELLAMLPLTIDTPDDEFFCLSVMTVQDDDDDDNVFWVGYNNTNERDRNPAAAALRLLVRVKADEVRNAD